VIVVRAWSTSYGVKASAEDHSRCCDEGRCAEPYRAATGRCYHDEHGDRWGRAQCAVNQACETLGRRVLSEGLVSGQHRLTFDWS